MVKGVEYGNLNVRVEQDLLDDLDRLLGKDMTRSQAVRALIRKFTQGGVDIRFQAVPILPPDGGGNRR